MEPEQIENDNDKLLKQILVHLKERKGNVNEDIYFASKVVANHPKAIYYFLEEFSYPVLDYISREIFHKPNQKEKDVPKELMGEYYMFIASPFREENNNVAEWKKVGMYAGRNGARLISYISGITKNHFVRVKSKSDKEKRKWTDVLEYVDYCALLGYDWEDEVDSEVEGTSARIGKAFLKLSEREQAVLRHLLINKEHWSEAFNILRVYLNPEGPNKTWSSWSHEEKQQAIDLYWSDKQKQDAMAALKNRAIVHLSSIYKQLKEEQ